MASFDVISLSTSMTKQLSEETGSELLEDNKTEAHEGLVKDDIT